MGVDVEEQAIHAKGKVSIQQRLHHCWRLVPYTTNLCESLCLNDILTIDMRTADGIEHIVGLIMCGGVKPEFAHGNVCIAIVTHSVAHHRGGYTFCRELNTILMGTIANSLEEHFILKFIDGLTDISENLLTLGSTLYGNTHHDGQPRNEVVATSTLKLFSKILAPILRTTLPGVDMHILHHIGKWAFFEFTKPAGNLFSDSSFRELVAF